MKLRFVSCLLIFCLLLPIVVSYAGTNEVQADPVFAQMQAVLNSNKKLDITAFTNSGSGSISVDACMLQVRVGSVWQNYGSLPPPTDTGNGTFDATVDYSGSIGVGTFRIIVTLNADGYTKDIYSNAKTFSS